MTQLFVNKKTAIASVALLPIFSNAALLRITVEAPSNIGLAPALLSFHDGTNDFFDTGSRASAGLEELAEVGSTGTLQGSLTTGDNVTIANGGPFAPGSSNTITFDVSDTNTMFSFAAMLLPSNDWFIGNNNAIDVSSVISGGLGASTVLDFGRVYDAGTELEDFAFSPGNPFIGIDTVGAPGEGAETDVDIFLVDSADPFSIFENISPGTFDSSVYDFNRNGVGGITLGRVTITNVPEPSTTLLGALGALGLLARRKRA